jgi:hypothetical protein
VECPVRLLSLRNYPKETKTHAEINSDIDRLPFTAANKGLSPRTITLTGDELSASNRMNDLLRSIGLPILILQRYIFIILIRHVGERVCVVTTSFGLQSQRSARCRKLFGELFRCVTILFRCVPDCERWSAMEDKENSNSDVDGARRDERYQSDVSLKEEENLKPFMNLGKFDFSRRQR